MAGGNARVVKPLLKKVNFEVIEKNIDQLLDNSAKYLEAIKAPDLKK